MHRQSQAGPTARRTLVVALAAGVVGLGVGLSRDEQARRALPVLKDARRAFLSRGTPLSESVRTGDVAGWCARLWLQRIVGPLVQWEPERTRAEVLAAVDRAIAECGGRNRGGWHVSGVRS